MALRCHRAGAVHSIICRPNSASGIHRNTFPIGWRHTAAISKKPLSLCDWCCNSNKYHACRNDGCGKNEICQLLNRYGIELGQCGPKCQPAESRRLSSVSPCGLSVASPGASFMGWARRDAPFRPNKAVLKQRSLKMQTLLVNVILAAAVAAVFLVARTRPGSRTGLPFSHLQFMRTGMGTLAKFFALFWGWADYIQKDWSNAPYKREYSARRARSVSYRSA
jgi:hypothetical protein